MIGDNLIYPVEDLARITKVPLDKVNKVVKDLADDCIISFDHNEEKNYDGYRLGDSPRSDSLRRFAFETIKDNLRQWENDASSSKGKSMDNKKKDTRP